MLTEAQQVAFYAFEMLESINILVSLIADSELTHAERKRQMKLLTAYIKAQQTRFIQQPTQLSMMLSISQMLERMEAERKTVERETKEAYKQANAAVPPQPPDTGDTPF